jgi:apolipoprotein N-acyltransferase
VICLNLLFANIFKALMLQKKHAALKNFTVVVLFIAINLSYGTFRYHQYNHPNIPATDNFKISLIQGNIPQEKKWSPTSRQEILTTYLEQTAAVIKESDLIVWPEASYPYSLAADIKRIPQLDLPITLLPHETSETAPLLLLGAATYLENRQEIMNSIFSVTSDGSVLQRYDKMRLVLYGEYIPLADFLPIKKLTHGLGSFTAGKLLQPLNFGSAQGSFQLAPLICYEVIYPDLARSYSKHGAGLLINVTNDAWFGVTSGPYQHINIARFRAIENRRYLARAANTGISAFIDPLGRIEPAAPINQLATLTHRIPYLNSSSIYSSFGDLACFGILTLLSLLLALTKN